MFKSLQYTSYSVEHVTVDFLQLQGHKDLHSLVTGSKATL